MTAVAFPFVALRDALSHSRLRPVGSRVKGRRDQDDVSRSDSTFVVTACETWSAVLACARLLADWTASASTRFEIDVWSVVESVWLAVDADCNVSIIAPTCAFVCESCETA